MIEVPTQAAEVVVPSSAEEAVSAFGDGDGTTVLAGGTIVMVELVHGRLSPSRVLMLERAGLTGLARDGERLTIGSMTPVAELNAAPEPLATAAGYVADPEVRAQATLGGNLCAPPGAESPRGDLQAALVALDAEVRSAGEGGERSDPSRSSSPRAPAAGWCSTSASPSPRQPRRPRSAGPTPTPTPSWPSTARGPEASCGWRPPGPGRTPCGCAPRNRATRRVRSRTCPLATTR